ncbi:hypothetical protein P9112_005181 [Eukaryota sp. TZLM1-RC]
MSVLFSQNTDTVKTNMQEHNRYAISIQTVVVGKVVENSKTKTRARDHPPPLLKEKRWKQARNHLPPLPNPTKCHKRFQERDHTPPHQKRKFLQGYEKLQSILDELDDEEKELRQQIVKDAEAHLEPTDYCLFEQLPPLWKQIPKTGR